MRWQIEGLRARNIQKLSNGHCDRFFFQSQWRGSISGKISFFDQPLHAKNERRTVSVSFGSWGPTHFLVAASMNCCFSSSFSSFSNSVTSSGWWYLRESSMLLLSSSVNGKWSILNEKDDVAQIQAVLTDGEMHHWFQQLVTIDVGFVVADGSKVGVGSVENLIQTRRKSQLWPQLTSPGFPRPNSAAALAPLVFGPASGQCLLVPQRRNREAHQSWRWKVRIEGLPKDASSRLSQTYLLTQYSTNEFTNFKTWALLKEMNWFELTSSSGREFYLKSMARRKRLKQKNIPWASPNPFASTDPHSSWNTLAMITSFVSFFLAIFLLILMTAAAWISIGTLYATLAGLLPEWSLNSPLELKRKFTVRLVGKAKADLAYDSNDCTKRLKSSPWLKWVQKWEQTFRGVGIESHSQQLREHEWNGAGIAVGAVEYDEDRSPQGFSPEMIEREGRSKWRIRFCSPFNHLLYSTLRVERMVGIRIFLHDLSFQQVFGHHLLIQLHPQESERVNGWSWPIPGGQPEDLHRQAAVEGQVEIFSRDPVEAIEKLSDHCAEESQGHAYNLSRKFGRMSRTLREKFVWARSKWRVE